MEDRKIVGYLRVSTADQDVHKNRADVLEFANTRSWGPVRFVTETVSGAKTWRDRKLAAIVDELGDGDILIVPELTRLGRSTLEVLEVLKEAKLAGIQVYSIKEGLELNGTIQAKIMSTMLALFAELERDFISMRTREGLRARKAAGVKLGRPRGPGRSKLDDRREEIVALLRNGSSKRFVARRYGTTTSNLYNWLRQNGIDHRPIV